MKIQINENYIDTIVANIGEPVVDSQGYTNIVIAEYWIDEKTFMFYTELFDSQGNFIDSIDDDPLTKEEKEEIKKYILKWNRD